MNDPRHDPPDEEDTDAPEPTWFESDDPQLSSGGSATASYYNIYRSFLAARAALGFILLTLQLGALAAGFAWRAPLLVLCVIYAAETISLWLAHRVRHPDKSSVEWTRLRRRQWLATIGFDLVGFSVLHALTVDTALNYQALLALPVLMAGVLTRRLFALAVAAGATLLLLSLGWLLSEANVIGASALLTQAGLTGGGLFAIALLANELAGRLASAQASAIGSKEVAIQQAELNQLMIEELHEGVLVMDRQGWVRAANPAARRLLAHDGMTDPAPFPMRGVEAWRPIVDAVDDAYALAPWPDEGRDVTLRLGSADAPLERGLRLRIRFTQSSHAPGPQSLCVLFLEDTRKIQARLREEKLAAMGRMSAGVAHEIRNPLASIAQANALLAEDLTQPTHLRLSGMVADNVERLKRIVTDVLAVASGGIGPAPPLALAPQVLAICREWQQTEQLPGDITDREGACTLRVDLPHAGREPLQARMDPDHLHRVVVNLLDNALRHGSRGAGSVQVVLKKTSATTCRLSVYSDGPPIPAEVERSLFEPFFSTRSQGTGLGLYISRQLCERAGARLDYRQRPLGHRHRNEFFISFHTEPTAATP